MGIGKKENEKLGKYIVNINNKKTKKKDGRRK